MHLEHSFTLPMPVDEAWRILGDIGTVSASMPGSKIEQAAPDRATGALKVKLGPMNLTYKGSAQVMESDESTHRAVIRAEGEDARNGSASATLVAALTEADGTTTVTLATDLEVTGKPAQFGPNVMADVGAKIVNQFAAKLTKAIAAGTVGGATSLSDTASADTASADTDAAASPAADAPVPPKAKPRPKPRKAPAETVDQTAPTPDVEPTVDTTPIASEVEAELAADAPEQTAPDTATPEPVPADPAAVDPESLSPESDPEPVPVAPAAPFAPAPEISAPTVDDAAVLTVNGHGSATPPVPPPPTGNGLVDLARPVLVRGVAPVAIAVLFVFGARRRRRGRGH